MNEQKIKSKFISNKHHKNERENIINEFKEGQINILICTNIVSHVLNIPVARTVVNFDMPLNEKGQVDLNKYFHRQGKTEKFEKNGFVINFIKNRNEEIFISQAENECGLIFEEFQNNEIDMKKIFDLWNIIGKQKLLLEKHI